MRRKMKPQDIQQNLNKKANEISLEFNGAPVVIIVAGSEEANIPATITGWANLRDGGKGRFRDLLGIVEGAKQIETLKHFPSLWQDSRHG
jgi:hypothetical protein